MWDNAGQLWDITRAIWLEIVGAPERRCVGTNGKSRSGSDKKGVFDEKWGKNAQ
jgi:hypothetical protein